MISRKTLLRNVAGLNVSAKELKERGFKFFKLLVVSDLDRSAIERSIEVDNGPFGVCLGSIRLPNNSIGFAEIKLTIRISIATLADNYCFS